MGQGPETASSCSAAVAAGVCFLSRSSLLIPPACLHLISRPLPLSLSLSSLPPPFSSVPSCSNYSNSSYTKNREAGMMIYESSAGGAAITAASSEGFEVDWSAALPYSVSNSYTSSQMAIITNTAAYTLNIPTPHISGAYITPTPFSVSFTAASEVYASPDYSRTDLMNDLDSVQSSLEVYIYQVTDTGICSKLLSLYNNGINVTLLVSKDILDNTDYELAKKCYSTLYNGGMNIQKSPSFYEFAHQKFWIIDGDRWAMSTGNWSPSDYPEGTSFPPYGSSGWQDVNRDYTVKGTNAEMAGLLRSVLNEDYSRGSAWYPY